MFLIPSTHPTILTILTILICFVVSPILAWGNARPTLLKRSPKRIPHQHNRCSPAPLRWLEMSLSRLSCTLVGAPSRGRY
ncbi:hypothetical protein BJX64DRAFT_29627 [Aspergillus heterothallicus]